ncbi:hypothetical protein HMPREF1860_00425 [Prevotella amnii]|uniref:Uncharacterized protein n=1 Tax=Prevotella amnii TaxID=419005 RepID=A0A134BJR3_9BACT|nr:hypothetical protein HMPREF1860_00425 [Prevotella amnii]
MKKVFSNLKKYIFAILLLCKYVFFYIFAVIKSKRKVYYDEFI